MVELSSDPNDPHAGLQPVRAGAPLKSASLVFVLLHGRGSAPENMLSLFEGIAPEGSAAIAPRAESGTWYPYSFLAPLDANEPNLSSAIKAVDSIVREITEQGVPFDKIVLLGFSQGACLACEYAARHPRRYGALIAFTGGIIGPPVAKASRKYGGSLAGTPVLLSAGDPDLHVPFERVRETKEILAGLGGVVDLRRHYRKPHSVSEEEIALCRELLDSISST